MSTIPTYIYRVQDSAAIWLCHEQKCDIKAITEHPTSGWDRESMRQCWAFLGKTNRSFAAVFKELEGDLARMVSDSPPPHTPLRLLPPRSTRSGLFIPQYSGTNHFLDMFVLFGAGYRRRRHDDSGRCQAAHSPQLSHPRLPGRHGRAKVLLATRDLGQVRVQGDEGDV